MAHYAICKYCNEKFDRDKEEFVSAGARRYAHKACAEAHNNAIPQEEKDYNELEKYIKKLFQTDNLNINIRKQIKEYKEQYGYSYTGMQKTLYWWYEIKKNPIITSYEGIAIVPYVYQEALQYYYNIYLAKIANENNSFTIERQEINISSPRVRINSKKLFNIDGEE